MDTKKQDDKAPDPTTPGSKATGASQSTQQPGSSKDKKTEDDAVERGKQAIEARKIGNNLSPEEHEQNEKKDAEQWRNEG